MALITCPECNGQVSDKAAVCPHCGFPISAQQKKPKEIKNEQASPAPAYFVVERIYSGRVYFRCQCGCTIEKPFSFINTMGTEKYQLREELICPSCGIREAARKILVKSTEKTPDEPSVCSEAYPCCGFSVEQEQEEMQAHAEEIASVHSPEPDTAAPQRDVEQESRSPSSGRFIAALVILLAILIWAGLSLTSKDKSPSHSAKPSGTSGQSSYSSGTSSKSYDDDEIKAAVYVLAEKSVKNHLKAPSTAEFSEMWNCAFTKGEDGVYMMTGYVASQNNYGAMLQEQWGIMAQVSGDKASLVMLTIGDQVYFD